MILVNLLGLVLIAFIVWWFWLYQQKPQVFDAEHQVIKVNSGVYLPAKLMLKANQAVQLRFLREDEAACSQTLVIPDLGISVDLSLGKETLVDLPALAKGEYAFHCQMQMYRGQLLVA